MGPVDLTEYCRQVEDHLTRVNGGHLVRIVGPGFELVRRWAEEGIPLSVVFRGIDLKADRHRRGAARRPLRIEFCDDDVRDVYEGWRRAVGLPRPLEAGASEAEPSRPRVPLTRHLDRVTERLSRVAGRLDLPEPLLQAIGALLEDLARLRELAKATRGRARDELYERLQALDERLLTAAYDAAPPDVRQSLRDAAAADLASFRARLSAEAWNQAMKVTVDRLLRDRYGLPTIVV